MPAWDDAGEEATGMTSGLPYPAPTIPAGPARCGVIRTGGRPLGESFPQKVSHYAHHPDPEDQPVQDP
jgi:hypothetical protein